MGGFRCRCCGKQHDELPMHYGASAPALWFVIPEAGAEVLALVGSVHHRRQALLRGG